MSIPPDEPCYSISVVAQMVDLHPQTLRNYEQLGLVVPQRTKGNRRLYSAAEVELLRKISRLTQELGVNLAGVILHMAGQIEACRCRSHPGGAALSHDRRCRRTPPPSIPRQPS